MTLHALCSSDNIKTMGKSDACLPEDGSSGTNFNGIGIVWHECVGASPVEGISSDRICAIRCVLDESATSVLTVMGVYLPCADLSIDCYSTHPLELERIICESQLLGWEMVLGDWGCWEEKRGGVSPT